MDLLIFVFILFLNPWSCFYLVSMFSCCYLFFFHLLFHHYLMVLIFHFLILIIFKSNWCSYITLFLFFSLFSSYCKKHSMLFLCFLFIALFYFLLLCFLFSIAKTPFDYSCCHVIIWFDFMHSYYNFFSFFLVCDFSLFLLLILFLKYWMWRNWF